jgi:hypothetical protein
MIPINPLWPVSTRRSSGLTFALLAIGFLAPPNPSASGADHEASPGFGLPVSCRLGEDCYVQQMPDIDKGNQELDPLCGKELPLPKLTDPVLAWIWAINVELGSPFRVHLSDPDGRTIIDAETKPLEARKANYVAYVGGKIAKIEGAYALRVDLLSGGKTMGSVGRSVQIER